MLICETQNLRQKDGKHKYWQHDWLLRCDQRILANHVYSFRKLSQSKVAGSFLARLNRHEWHAKKYIPLDHFWSQSNLTLLKKLELFRSGNKTGQYQLSDEHSTTILAIPPRKGRLPKSKSHHSSQVHSILPPKAESSYRGHHLFPTQNNTLWGGGGYASKLPYVCIVWPLQNGWFKDLKSKGTKKLHIPLTSLQLNHGGTKVTSGPVLWRTGPRGSGDLGRTQLKLPWPPLLTNELGQKSWKMKVWYMIFPFQGLLFRFPQCC